MELTESRLFELKTEATEMLEDLGLQVPDYTFKITNTKNRAGHCDLRKKEIGVSRYVSHFHTEHKVLNTVVHEILHAIAWEDCRCNTHTGAWKQLANKVNRKYDLGIKRAYKMTQERQQEEFKTAKYAVKCEGCGHTIVRHRKSKLIQYTDRYRCGNCGANLKRIK